MDLDLPAAFFERLFVKRPATFVKPDFIEVQYDSPNEVYIYPGLSRFTVQ